MATPSFPAFLRPQITYSYNHSGENLIGQKVSGGVSSASRMYHQEKVIFNVSFVCKTIDEMIEFNRWYFNDAIQGSKKFYMDLNASGVKETCVCLIIPGTLNVVQGIVYTVTMQIESEKIYSGFGGDLYELASQGYSNIKIYASEIEKLANQDLI